MIHIIRLTILKAFHSFDNNQQTNPAIKGNMLTAGMIKKPDIGISHMNSAITCTKIAKKTSPIIMSFFFIFFSSPPIILPFRHDCRINSSVQMVQPGVKLQQAHLIGASGLARATPLTRAGVCKNVSFCSVLLSLGQGDSVKLIHSALFYGVLALGTP